MASPARVSAYRGAILSRNILFWDSLERLIACVHEVLGRIPFSRRRRRAAQWPQLGGLSTGGFSAACELRAKALG
jgi:hypothetical protein